MANERSQSPRATWRGNTEAKPSARPQKSEYKWTERGAKPAAGPARGQGSRSVRIASGLIGFAACLMLVVWLIWMINPPKPAAVILVGADYATNLAVPHNVLGWQGLEGIEQLSKTPQPWSLFNPE